MVLRVLASDDLAHVARMRLGLFQPCGWVEPKARYVELRASDLLAWFDTVFLPAMERADPRRDDAGEVSVIPGEHCQFCRCYELQTFPWSGLTPCARASASDM